MAKTNFNWNTSDVLITYDLSNNDVSAKQIADNSRGRLSTSIRLKNGEQYLLPNTTLWCSGSKAEANSIFVDAFNKASTSYLCKINRLLVTEARSQSAFVQN